MVARLVRDQEVACSNPVTSTNQNASELSLAFLLFIPINNFVCKAAEPVGCGRRLPQKCKRFFGPASHHLEKQRQAIIYLRFYYLFA